ncbi:PQQ-binding-like beta-propeller repeat protein [Streptomyces sp. M19]
MLASDDLLIARDYDGVYALNPATGTQQWTVRLGNSGYDPSESLGLAVNGGTLYAVGEVTDESVEPEVLALAAATGKRKWFTESEDFRSFSG